MDTKIHFFWCVNIKEMAHISHRVMDRKEGGGAEVEELYFTSCYIDHLLSKYFMKLKLNIISISCQ